MKDGIYNDAGMLKFAIKCRMSVSLQMERGEMGLQVGGYLCDNSTPWSTLGWCL